MLSRLPNTIPTSYDFLDYKPDPEKIELFGCEESAFKLNNVLEITLAPDGCKPGPNPFEILEKGPELLAVVAVL